MTLVAAFLVPGHPLPFLQPQRKPFQPISAGYAAARERLRAARPDVVVAYSTQWIAVLDELWQTRPRLQGVHVDENWYDYGDLDFDMQIDRDLAQACVTGSKEIGVSAKDVDYEDFPIDTGAIVMANSLDPEHRLKYVLASNNLYHDGATTARLAEMAVQHAQGQGKRVALVGVGGLSGTIFRQRIDLDEDHIASEQDDACNRALLSTLESGDAGKVQEMMADYIPKAKPDMGMKHLSWLLGGMGPRYVGATVLGYGPAYGTGQAVVEFTLQ
jgi:2-aminophenol/2-amino-5-chlorophenol 1,6-dioxygenase alpha subunit